MYSSFIRILYSFSYFSLMLILIEVVNIVNSWDILDFYWNSNVIDGLQAFCVIHYPFIIFVLMLLFCKYILVDAHSKLAKKQLKVVKSNPIGLDSFFFLGQLVPLLTLSEKIFDPSSSLKYFAIFIVLMLLYFISYGSFNMSLYLMQYHQYKVSTNSSEYWLISKRKIRDFSQSFTVVEISNRILLRV